MGKGGATSLHTSVHVAVTAISNGDGDAGHGDADHGDAGDDDTDDGGHNGASCSDRNS